MAFIIETLNADIKTSRKLFDEYYTYLSEKRSSFPQEAYDFATASWHYDPTDHRCPHDAWLEELKVYEPFEGERREKRSINIIIRLLGPYHDGYIELKYFNVARYAVNTPMSELIPNHGDWLIDEVRLSDEGRVVHEIVFHRGTQVEIESENILYTWIEI